MILRLETHRGRKPIANVSVNVVSWTVHRLGVLLMITVNGKKRVYLRVLEKKVKMHSNKGRPKKDSTRGDIG